MSKKFKQRILDGAMAKLLVDGKVIGFFTTCTWSVRQEKVPIYVLGRHSPAEIVSTAQDVVSISVTGFKTLPTSIKDGEGNKMDKITPSSPHAFGNKDVGMTKLGQLVNGDVKFSVAVSYRNQPEVILFKSENCTVVGYSSGVAARSVADIRLDIIGEYVSEIDGDSESMTEGAEAADLNIT